MGLPLSADVQFLDELLVAFAVFLFQIVQQTPTGTDHLDQAEAGTVVLCMRHEVLGKHVDALGQQGNLHVAGACIPLMPLKLLLDGLLIYLAHSSY